MRRYHKQLSYDSVLGHFEIKLLKYKLYAGEYLSCKDGNYEIKKLPKDEDCSDAFGMRLSCKTHDDHFLVECCLKGS